MSEVNPKLVRSRLAKMPIAGPHPDADQLTAFAERALAGKEREGVLAHLATCADCREVVALAAPEASAEELEAVAPARPRWLPWPVLRWGALAAAVVLVAVAVIMQAPEKMRQQEPRSTSALGRRDTTVSASPKTEADKSVSSPSAAIGTLAAPKAAESKTPPDRDLVAGRRKEEGLKRQDDGRMQAAVVGGGIAAGSGGGIGGGVYHVPSSPATAPLAKDRKLADQPRAMEAAAKPAPPRVAMPPSPTASSGSGATDEITMANAAAAPAPEAAPARAKEKSATSAADYGPSYAGGLAAQSPATNAQHAQLRAATLRWTVTSDGRVQRSSDAGRSWTDVPVAPDRKNVKFRALTTDGAEIWVGGTRGALYYSPDAGATWSAHPVEQLTGDIIRLTVNGRTLIISTSAGQTIELSHDVFSNTVSKPASSR